MLFDFSFVFGLLVGGCGFFGGGIFLFCFLKVKRASHLTYVKWLTKK